MELALIVDSTQQATRDEVLHASQHAEQMTANQTKKPAVLSVTTFWSFLREFSPLFRAGI